MITYEIPQFDQLEPGQVVLGVPIVGGAVQLGTRRVTETEPLVVNKSEPGRITISREGGLVLQIDAAYNDATVGGHRVPILARPVAHIALQPGQREGIWAVEEGVSIHISEHEALGEFLRTVAVFALDKQPQEARRLAAQTLIEACFAQERELTESV